MGLYLINIYTTPLLWQLCLVENEIEALRVSNLPKTEKQDSKEVNWKHYSHLTPGLGRLPSKVQKTSVAEGVEKLLTFVGRG